MKNQEGAKTLQEQTIGRMINFRPIFCIALFLICGIWVGYARLVDEKSVWLPVSIALLLPVLIVLCSKHKNRFIAYMVVFYLSFFVGMTSFSAAVFSYRDAPVYNGEYLVTGTVVEKNVAPSGGEIVFTNLEIDGESVKGYLSCNLSEGYFTSLEFCDRVQFRLTLSTNTKTVGKYGFRAEAIADLRLYEGSNLQEINVQGVEFRLGAYIRGRIQNALYTGMSEENAAVATAILLGNTSGIEAGFLENVRYGGVAHIFAVSGLHIGAVFAFCLWLFRRKRVPAPIRFVVIATILFLYGGVCGYSASVVRAVITCLVLYGCTLLGVKYDGLESLSLAACLVFLFYPTLLFGVGAQLSFSACLGILLLARPLQKFFGGCVYGLNNWMRYTVCKQTKPAPPNVFKGNTPPPSLPKQAVDKVLSFLAVSIAAQLGTMPITYLSFGYLSVASLLLNCIYVPLITIGFSPLLLFAVVGAILPTSVLPAWFYLPNLLLGASTLLFHVLDFSSGIVQSVQLRGAGVVCYYAALFAITDKINAPKWLKGGAAVMFAACFVLSLCI